MSDRNPSPSTLCHWLACAVILCARAGLGDKLPKDVHRWFAVHRRRRAQEFHRMGIPMEPEEPSR